MQAYHRRRHRILWVVIAILVPIAIAVALIGRDGIPYQEAAAPEVEESVEP